MCPSCNNHNFQSRQVCNRCGGPKPPPAGAISKPGDWMCPSCENHNYATRQACNRCGMPKPGTFAGAMQGMMNMQWGGGKGGMAQMGQMAAAGPGGMKPGDWMCAECNNHNYSSRQVCNKCGGPKTQQANFGVAMMKGGAPRGSPYGMGNGMGKGMGNGMGMQQPGTRPGDWICPGCNNHNYASRDNCNKCQHPRAAPVSFRGGDWMCPACQNHNYASRDNCNKCQAPKPM